MKTQEFKIPKFVGKFQIKSSKNIREKPRPFSYNFFASTTQTKIENKIDELNKSNVMFN